MQILYFSLVCCFGYKGISLFCLFYGFFIWKTGFLYHLNFRSSNCCLNLKTKFKVISLVFLNRYRRVILTISYVNICVGYKCMVYVVYVYFIHHNVFFFFAECAESVPLWFILREKTIIAYLSKKASKSLLTHHEETNL